MTFLELLAFLKGKEILKEENDEDSEIQLHLDTGHVVKIVAESKWESSATLSIYVINPLVIGSRWEFGRKTWVCMGYTLYNSKHLFLFQHGDELFACTKREFDNLDAKEIK